MTMSTSSTTSVRFQIFDLTNPGDAILIEPGFYWLIPLDGDQAQPNLADDHPVHLTGPFATHEEAREDVTAWIKGVLSLVSPANDDVAKRKAA